MSWEIEHYATILAGCESVISGSELSYEGRYTKSVLQLHASDLGHVAGTEGFMDAIKKGASNLKEWLLKLLSSIAEFINEITGGAAKRRQIEAEQALRKQMEEADAAEKAALKTKTIEVAKEVFAEPVRLSRIVYDDIVSLGYLDGDQFEAFDVNNMRIHSAYDRIKSTIYYGEHPDEHIRKDVVKSINDIKDGIEALSRDAKRAVSEYANEEEANAQRKAINAAGQLLTKFTKVLKYWNDGLIRFDNKML